jgi:N5-(cytidine 5'-diphosphoramidyl)-L-glutamine hydrolase
VKRIGITQRVSIAADRSHRLDCLDQAWFELAHQIDVDLVIVPNASRCVADWARRRRLEGLILSGGNDLAHLEGAREVAAERDATETALLGVAEEEGIPVLGVCRGMQLINHRFGGRLSKVSGHAGRRHAVYPCGDVGVFCGFSDVDSFHNWGITQGGLAQPLKACLASPDGFVEALRHTSLPWFGMMWHPERSRGADRVADLALLSTVFGLRDGCD